MEELIAQLVNGMILNIKSDGKKVMITPAKEIILGKLHIEFVESDSSLDGRLINAVFLIGFIGDKIITARNERGWDVPGGHVEPKDIDLLASLKREVKEEAGTIIDGLAIPFALLQFEDNPKKMLFYVSDNCRLVDFVSSEDALERKLMSVSEFIDSYNWGKEVMEILVAQARYVLKIGSRVPK